MRKSFVPRKRLGQHFLIDTVIIDQIVRCIDPKPTDNLVEIGPGMGALTVSVLKKAKKITAIELDANLIPALEEICAGYGELLVFNENALSFDFDKLGQMRLFGNLPYNISTPLLFYLLRYAAHIQDMHFMLQKEVVERLAARPGSHSYGRLSVMIQYHCKAESLLEIPASAFFPPPKVESAVVRLIPYLKLPYTALDYKLFENIVRQAFSMRRKTLRNALKKFVNPEMWEVVGIDNQLRPETLSVEGYVRLSNAIYCQST